MADRSRPYVPDCAHSWGPVRRWRATAGPMEGTWRVRSCRFCNAGTIESVEAPEMSLAAFVAALEAHDTRRGAL